MVKNKTGGNRHKKMASKNAKPSYKRKTRFSQCDDEIYGVITQNCGGGHAMVLCQDNVQRLLVIRRKFSGRNKRDNKIVNFGFTNIGGRPHAEALALEGIKFRNNFNYTLYS